MPRILLVVGVAVIVLGSIGCGGFAKPEAADKFASEYFTCIKEQRFDDALAMYSPEFFEATGPQEWSATLRRLTEKLGELRSHELTTWRTHSVASTGGSGTYYALVYQVNYSEYSAQETLTLFQPRDSEVLSIRRHSIASEGLLK